MTDLEDLARRICDVLDDGSNLLSGSAMHAMLKGALAAQEKAEPVAWCFGASFWQSKAAIPHVCRNDAEPLYAHPAASIGKSDDNEDMRTPTMNSEVRKVLKHHRLTQHGDGVVEADLIYAVLKCLPQRAPQQEPAPHAEAPIYCAEKLKPGGCQLHNLHCGWPACNQPAQRASYEVPR